MSPPYPYIRRLERAWRPQHLISIHEPMLWFTTVYAIKREFHLFTIFDRSENSADFKNCFEYCNMFLRASLLCFYFSVSVVIIKCIQNFQRDWNDRHKPFSCSVLSFPLFRELSGVMCSDIHRQQTVGLGRRNFLSHKLFQ